jgi:DNA polymerase I-like protein with 3'-5' exonuclease and polymerase domains
VAYGGNANTVADNLGLPIKECVEHEEKYFKAFSGLKDYFERQTNTSIDQGYILTNNVTKRRIQFYKYREFENKRIELCNLASSSLNKDYLGLSSEFWELWKKAKSEENTLFLDYLKPNISAYFGMRSAMKNSALNYPCQSSAADMTKLALIQLYNWIVEENLLWKVKIVNVVHDEIVLEVPIELTERVSTKLIECMERAGDVFSSIKMTADYEISKSWEH